MTLRQLWAGIVNTALIVALVLAIGLGVCGMVGLAVEGVILLFER